MLGAAIIVIILPVNFREDVPKRTPAFSDVVYSTDIYHTSKGSHKPLGLFVVSAAKAPVTWYKEGGPGVAVTLEVEPGEGEVYVSLPGKFIIRNTGGNPIVSLAGDVFHVKYYPEEGVEKLFTFEIFEAGTRLQLEFK